MSRKKGCRYLTADVIALSLDEPTPVWICYDERRSRFAATRDQPRGRYRVEVGPYTSASQLQDVAQDVELAVADLRARQL